MGYRSFVSSLPRHYPALDALTLLEVRNLELLKWTGFFCMLFDHVGVYVFGQSVPILEHIGALAFPLFAVAFAAGLAHRPMWRAWDVLPRVMTYAAAAQFAVLLVRPEAWWYINVLGTFALGMLCYLGFADRLELAQRFICIACAVAGAQWVEFGPVGVLFVASACWWQRGGGWLSFVSFAVSLAFLCTQNQGSHAAIAVIPIVAVVSLFSFDIPRIRGGFYTAYVAQYPALAAVRAFFA